MLESLFTIEKGAPMSKVGAPVYVVDDDLSVREAVGSLIRSAGWRAETFASADEFLAFPQVERPSCLVLDVELPGLSGLELQQQLAKADVLIPIIFLTGRGDIPMSVRAIKAGALEFLTKPVDDEALLDAIRQGLALYQTPRQPLRNSAQNNCGRIIGKCPAVKAVLSQVELVAPTDSTVLISGETGTGKELVARAIHRRSQRCSRAFVGVNCAAIPQALITSELFGHEKGAFTGAVGRRPGRFELAEGGTIFLDEVGELPPETQISLLRVLQEREFERVGGNQSIHADVRVIAATNRDLQAAMAAGAFRSDLFYRLNVFPIAVPPLRERTEDIPMLVECFIDLYARKTGRRMRPPDQGTLELLQSYSWPGNIRELQNVIERSIILCESDEFILDPGWVSLELSPSEQGQRPLAKKSAAQEKEIIEEALARTGGRVSGPAGAAAMLGIPASTLESKIRALKIVKYRFKAQPLGCLPPDPA